MDSKYTSVGLEKPNLNLKRKNIIVDNLKVKKTKLTNDGGSVLPTCAGNGFVAVQNIVQKNVHKIGPKEDLLEARKRLPVYMVRGR